MFRALLWLRSTLLALLALVAGCATEPPPPTEGDAVPERLVTADAIGGWERAGEWLVSPRLEAPGGATRVGLLLSTVTEASRTPILEARGLDGDDGDGDGDPGEWVRVEVTYRGGTQRVARADLGLLARAAQVRLRASDLDVVADLMWSAVVPVPPRTPGTTQTTRPGSDSVEVAGRSEALRSELSDLVNDRASWGARATTCTTADESKYRMAIHHTVTPSSGDPAARIRGIQAYHMDTRGWCDIGYHFLVSIDGQLWEGRPLNLLGAHVAGHNTGNIGISFIGCFHTSECSDWTPFVPPPEMIDAGAALVERLAGLYGITVSATTVKGHRDHTGATTACPGDNLEARLDDIRSGASTPAEYAAEFVDQSFPLASEPYELGAGTEDTGYMELRNVGAATWLPGETFLGTTEPRDADSALVGSDWVSPTRAATVDREVAPGETGRFVFSVRAPDAPGDYPQFFNLVEEGVAWFGDPSQGGPPDDQIEVRVTSVAWDAGTPDAGAADAAAAGPDASAGSGIATHAQVTGGCGCATPGGSAGEGWPPVLLVMVVLWMGRRRGILAQWRR